jgi:hypothetical protein
MMIEAACSISKRSRAKGVLLYGDMIDDYEALAKIGQEKKVELILAIQNSASFEEASSVFKKVLKIPEVPVGRINQVKMAILQGLAKGLLKEGDKWVCLSGIPQPRVLDSLLILELGVKFEIITSSDLPVLSEVCFQKSSTCDLNPCPRVVH